MSAGKDRFIMIKRYKRYALKSNELRGSVSRKGALILAWPTDRIYGGESMGYKIAGADLSEDTRLADHADGNHYIVTVAKQKRRRYFSTSFSVSHPICGEWVIY